MQATAAVAAQALATCWRDTLAEELRHTDESLAAVPQQPDCNPMHLDATQGTRAATICVRGCHYMHSGCRSRHAGCAPMRMHAGVAAACFLLTRDDTGE